MDDRLLEIEHIFLSAWWILRFIDKEAIKMSKKQKKMQTGKQFSKRISPILFKSGTSIVDGSDVGYRRKDKNKPG